MCVRFSLTTNVGELERRFRIEQAAELETNRYNIAPTQSIPIIRNNRLGVRIWMMHAGACSLFGQGFH